MQITTTQTTTNTLDPLTPAEMETLESAVDALTEGRDLIEYIDALYGYAEELTPIVEDLTKILIEAKREARLRA